MEKVVIHDVEVDEKALYIPSGGERVHIIHLEHEDNTSHVFEIYWIQNESGHLSSIHPIPKISGFVTYKSLSFPFILRTNSAGFK